MTPLLLVVLAQSAPPLVAAPNSPAAPYVLREHGEVCVVEPAQGGGETKSCRKEGSDYSGAAAAPPPAVKDSSPAEHERPPSQFGIALKLGAVFPFGEDNSAAQSSMAFHGRVGLRYALLDRSKNPGRPNVAVAILGGGDLEGLRGGLGVESRLEGTAGGDNALLEPLFNAFVSAGAQYLLSERPEFHFGGGVSLDFLFTGVLGNGPLFIPSGSGAIAAVIAFILAPTVEYRYVMRSDGTHYNAVLLAMGM